MNRQDRLANQRLQRKANNNAWTKKYEKTKKGFLMRLYRNMQSRIAGIQRTKFYLYKGKSLLDRQVFYEWSLSNPRFHDLFEKWVESGYERKLTPSIDRINVDKGYEIGNMQWLTMSENSRYGSLHNLILHPTYKQNFPNYRKLHQASQ